MVYLSYLWFSLIIPEMYASLNNIWLILECISALHKWCDLCIYLCIFYFVLNFMFWGASNNVYGCTWFTFTEINSVQNSILWVHHNFILPFRDIYTIFRFLLLELILPWTFLYVKPLAAMQGSLRIDRSRRKTALQYNALLLTSAQYESFDVQCPCQSC